MTWRKRQITPRKIIQNDATWNRVVFGIRCRISPFRFASLAYPPSRERNCNSTRQPKPDGTYPRPERFSRGNTGDRRHAHEVKMTRSRHDTCSLPVCRHTPNDLQRSSLDGDRAQESGHGFDLLGDRLCPLQAGNRWRPRGAVPRWKPESADLLRAGSFRSGPSGIAHLAAAEALRHHDQRAGSDHTGRGRHFRRGVGNHRRAAFCLSARNQ